MADRATLTGEGWVVPIIDPPAGGDSGAIPAASTIRFIAPSGDTTGTTDDANYLAAYNDIVGGGGGGVILYGVGTFYSKSPVIVEHDNIGIQALAPGLTKIVVASGWTSTTGPGGAAETAVVTFVGVDNFFCRGLEVDASVNNRVCNGIQAVTTEAMGVGTPCTNGVISGNKVKVYPGANYHIWSQRGRHIKILDNVVDGSETVYSDATTQEGIEVYGGYDVLVQGNHVKNVGNFGIYLQSLPAQTPNCEMEIIKVLGNTVEGSKAGVYAHPQYHATHGDAYLKDCIISDNIIRGCWLHGIKVVLTTAGVTLDGLTISDNIIRGPASGGQAASSAIFLENQVSSVSTVTIRNINVHDNQARDIPLTDSGAPYRLDYFNNFQFHHNRLINAPASGSSQGLQCANCSDFEIESNTIDGARQFCIRINVGSRFSLKDNVCLNFNLSAVGTAGITVLSGSDFQVEDNELDTATITSVGSLVNLGTSCDKFRVRSNRYRNKASNRGAFGTYNFGSLAWAASTAKTIKSIVRATAGGGFYYECVTAGTTSGSEPTWNNQEGALTTDGGVTWAARSIH